MELHVVNAGWPKAEWSCADMFDRQGAWDVHQKMPEREHWLLLKSASQPGGEDDSKRRLLTSQKVRQRIDNV
jgi:hypothetical protein